MPSFPYPGDSRAKRQARAYLYSQQVALRLPLPTGNIITLAGDVPFDLPYLRDVLMVNPQVTWFVDKKLAGLKLVNKFWPEAQTYNGWLLNLIHELPTIAFVNLDFMGQYLPRFNGKGPEPCVKAMRGKLVPGAIISLTFYAGREDKDKEYNKRVLLLGEQCGGKTLEEKRWLGTFAALQEDVGTELTILGRMKYRNGQSSMGMLVVQVPKGK